MLMVFISVLSFLVGAVMTGIYVTRRMARLVDKEAGKSMGNMQLAHAMIRWVKIKQDENNLATALIKRSYKKIAIYGMADVGERLLAELQNSGVEVAYGIDQNATNLFAPIELLTPDEALPLVDAIIVTPLNYFDEIETILVKRTDIPILSIEDLMFGL
ncbi:hypothetical protein [Pectinatus frisingensis]|uniref:hypothetical protein n=1 Tax=Pectinatus frisingensis TaxID=865 RepID=UPI0018C59020|nr:hypothetical protein [Pectinatus frisingensis]